MESNNSLIQAAWRAAAMSPDSPQVLYLRVAANATSALNKMGQSRACRGTVVSKTSEDAFRSYQGARDSIELDKSPAIAGLLRATGDYKLPDCLPAQTVSGPRQWSWDH